MGFSNQNSNTSRSTLNAVCSLVAILVLCSFVNRTSPFAGKWQRSALRKEENARELDPVIFFLAVASVSFIGKPRSADSCFSGHTQFKYYIRES